MNNKNNFHINYLVILLGKLNILAVKPYLTPL